MLLRLIISSCTIGNFGLGDVVVSIGGLRLLLEGRELAAGICDDCLGGVAAGRADVMHLGDRTVDAFLHRWPDE